MLLYLKSASKLCTVQRVYLIVMICYLSRVFISIENLLRNGSRGPSLQLIAFSPPPSRASFKIAFIFAHIISHALSLQSAGKRK